MNKITSSADRDMWSSKFGFIMSAAGSAVGLGNIWKFPYVCATGGGALFLAAYIFFAVVLGFPILLTELAVGRSGGGNAVASCRKIDGKWGFTGMFGIVCAVIVLSYYSVVGGWVIKYFIRSITGSVPEASFFYEYSARTAEPLLWQAVFIVLNGMIVVFGISKGIEKVSSVLLPLLIVFLAGIMIYSLTLPGAADGVKFLLVPDVSRIKSSGGIMSVIVSALGQVFFSLSLGMGTLITYGSYLDRDNRLVRSTVSIIAIDTLIALISGLTVIPAVFSFGLAPDEGPGLIFSTLSGVFGQLRWGALLSALFFLLVLFAAVTSAISLLEVIAAFLTEHFAMKRSIAVLLPVVLIILLSVPASMSWGVLSDLKLMGMTVFELLIFLSDRVIMPLGGFFLCILAGFKWGKKNLNDEITSGGKYPFALSGIFDKVIKYAAPALIAAVFITGFLDRT